MSSQIVNMQSLNWDALFQQSGSGIPKFVGIRGMRGGQRGNGLGAILLSAIPTLVRLVPQLLGSPVGEQLINSGASVIKDLSEGTSVKDAVKKEGRKVIKNMTGIGRKKRLTGYGRSRDSIKITAVGEPKRSKNLVGVIKPGHSIASAPGKRLLHL